MSCVKRVTGLRFLCENITFILNNEYKYNNFAQLFIGHNYAHLKSDALSLEKSIYKLSYLYMEQRNYLSRHLCSYRYIIFQFEQTEYTLIRPL